MASKIERTEDVSIIYKGGKITVIGATFRVELAVSSSELSKVYWGSQGKGKAKATVHGVVPEAK